MKKFEETLAAAYDEQLKDIGRMLVRYGVLTRRAIARHGVRFALRERFAPPPAPVRVTKKKRSRRA